MIKLIRDLRYNKHFIKFVIGTIIFAICITIVLLYIPKQSLGKTENEEVAEEVEDAVEELLIVVLPEEELEEMSEEEMKASQVDKSQIKNEKNLPTYYIKINYGANVVNIYKKDENNEYTIPVKAMLCSTGTATPKSGVYKMSSKYRWLTLFGNVYGQYCSRIVGHILFHSVPYLEKGNNGSIEYWEYDKLGQSASAGCIRLTVADALWIYNNCASGTMVEFYSSDDPGPFGKPTARKISSAPENIRGWDPTDPDANNPWNTYNNAEVGGQMSEDESKDDIAENNGSKDDTAENNMVDNNIEDETNNNEEDDENNNIEDGNILNGNNEEYTSGGIE